MADGIPTFKIPGNVKQFFTPFVINPKDAINSPATESSLVKGKPQFFSYRTKTYQANKAGRLGIYPNANNYSLDKDISFELLYQDNIKEKDSLTIKNLINNIPAISIREFLPDTRLDQCLNFFKDMFNAAQDTMASSKSKKTASSEIDFKTLANNIWACAQYTLLYMLGIEWKVKDGPTYNAGGKAGFFKDFVTNGGSLSNPTAKYSIDTEYKDKVLNFPFMFYYRLQSCVTTNVYEIPAITDGKIINQSDGKAGWGSGSGFLESGGVRASGFLNKIPIVGELANTLLGNIGINYMPWWNPEEGSKTPAPEITVKFDLFNDTIEKAVANFIFVNTIIPGNRWIQYGMFQHSSNLYDVKIEGLNRLFACAASFNVTYDGVLRNPPDNFYDGSDAKTLSLKGHISPNIDETSFLENLKKNNLIKIPDVYHVEMSFKSLLPANFNNFLFTYSNNVGHMEEYGEKAYQGGVGEALGKTVGKFVNNIKKVFESGDVNAGFGGISNDGFYKDEDGNVIE